MAHLRHAPGLDLTAPFAELLIVEARVAMVDDQAPDATDDQPEGVTFYRRARGLAGLTWRSPGPAYMSNGPTAHCPRTPKP